MWEQIISTPFRAIDWALTELAHWALDAPDNHLYIAMAIAGVVLVGLLWSMIPKRAHRVRIVNIEPTVIYPQKPIERIEICEEPEYNTPYNVTVRVA